MERGFSVYVVWTDSFSTCNRKSSQDKRVGAGASDPRVPYLDVEADGADGCSDLFVAQLHRQLIGHVLKVVQQGT